VCIGCTNQYTSLELPNTQVIKVKLAVTDKEQQQGLSYINEMKGYDGMLFIRSKAEQVSFWMNEMKFPLDIIYLDKDMKVLEVFADQQPCEQTCEFVTSHSSNVKYILELKSGDSKKVGIDINNIIKKQ